MTEAHRLGFLLREKGALLASHVTMATVVTATVRTALPYASLAPPCVNINSFPIFLTVLFYVSSNYIFYR